MGVVFGPELLYKNVCGENILAQVLRGVCSTLASHSLLFSFHYCCFCLPKKVRRLLRAGSAAPPLTLQRQCVLLAKLISWKS